MAKAYIFEQKEGLVYDMPSEFYHSIAGIYSSSQLKVAFQDIKLFHRLHITKTVAKEEGIPAFDIGTYFHTALLEPHKLKEDCVVYQGKRLGGKWDAFKKHNIGKAIITETEYTTAKRLIEAVQNSPVAMGRLSRGTAEVSCFAKLLISGGEIFSPTYMKLLTRNGWESVKTIPKKGIEVWVKVRADKLADTYVLDLKSTRGDTEKEYQMQVKVTDYEYALSAAMYLDIFSLIMETELKEFIWVFASKDMFNCKSYIASRDNILIGRHKWRKAILNLAYGLETAWKFEDSMGILDPQLSEYEHIRNKNTEEYL